MCIVKIFSWRQIFWSSLCIEDEKKNTGVQKEFIIFAERKSLNWNKKHTTDASRDRQSDREAESIWNL